MSSRNVRLSPEERRAAPVLFRALRDARALIKSGERRAEPILRRIRAQIAEEPLARLDYVAVVDARNLNPLERLEGRVLIPIAAWLGTTRLIDNLELSVRAAP